jgi:hypothetical protein
MTPSDQNKFLHVLNAQPKALCEGKPAVDMLDHPLTKVSSRKGVLTSGIYWKI